jgi:multidrug efflux pump subunit AcrA (membrane-fusion protein)
VRSPFRGVVVERFVNAGERVEDKPLLRLAMLDPLRVEIVMPASRWGSVAVNQSLSVVPELPGAGSMAARVTHVDKIIDAASNTFRVRLSLPNPGNRLPAGARCKVDEPGLSATSLPARGSL